VGRKRTKPQKVDAAFTPDGKSICPLCWSRPSVTGRYANDGPRTRGWGLTVVEKVIRFAGQTFGYAHTLKYPCSNSACLAEIVVEWMAHETGKEGHAHLLKAHQLRGADADKYVAGHTDARGVWKDEPAPAPVVVPLAAPKRSRATREEAPVMSPAPEPVRDKPTRKPRSDKGQKRGPRTASAPEPAPVKRRKERSDKGKSRGPRKPEVAAAPAGKPNRAPKKVASTPKATKSVRAPQPAKAGRAPVEKAATKSTKRKKA
jgi:hypothetical protein